MDAPEKLAVFCQNGAECSYDLSSLIPDDSDQRASKAMATNIPLTDFDLWPDSETTLLDDFQTDAVKSALTQEVTAITGAPGTGKTHVGLKIVEVLMRNRRKWGVNLADENNQRVDSGPVLLVSPDDDSLDNFLEGILTFQDKGVVRFGKPSKNPTMKQLDADVVKGAKRKGNTSKTTGTLEEQDQLRDRLRKIQSNVGNSRQTIISATSLKPVMSSSHFERISQAGGMAKWIVPNEAPKTKVTDTPEEFQEGDAWVECSLKIEYDPDKKYTSGDGSGESKAKKQKLMARLRHTDIMKKQEVEDKTDVLSLTADERWRMYRYWLHEFKVTAAKRIQDVCREVENSTQEWRKSEKTEYDIQEDTFVGMTSAAAVKHHRLLRYLQPKIIVVDQASDIMEGVLLATVTQNCRQLIMIGDSKPCLRQNPAILNLAERSKVSLALFQRFLERQYAVKPLKMEHRMRPDISKFIKLESYPDLKDHTSVTRMEDIRGIIQNVYFVSHNCSPDVASTHEVKFVTALCQYLIGQGERGDRITVLTNTQVQLKRFRQEMGDALFQGVTCYLLEDFCGENEVILLATFQMNKGSGHKLKTEEFLVKALSRAKRGFYAIGNFHLLATQNDKWQVLLEEAKRVNRMGRELLLTCSNHPDQDTIVSSAEDIMKRVTDEGCGRTCNARLRCGHSCKLPCHKHDNKQMGAYQCEQRCQKPIPGCPAGHKCTKLCYAKCDKKCDKESERQLPCGHTQQVPCSLPDKDVTCKALCGKSLECGHPCRNACGEPCSAECQEEVTKEDWPCQHHVKVYCSATPDMCPYPCKEMLKCQHPCQGSCGSCMRGRVHVSCKKKCNRILVCGHQCKSKCSTTCPPCTEDCQNKCKHSRCTEPCGEKCIPCQEHCEWQCPHQSCRQVCSQPCDREPCKQPCRKRLRCTHECIGLCGEPCPKKCRVCNADEVKETFFGEEDEPDARQVKLSNC